MSRLRCRTHLALLALLAASAEAAVAEECRLPANLPVSLVILASGARVQELARSVRDARVLRADADTVVFDDGRVITADVSAAGEHLNALGWADRRIEIAASVPRRRALPRGSYG